MIKDSANGIADRTNLYCFSRGSKPTHQKLEAVTPVTYFTLHTYYLVR